MSKLLKFVSADPSFRNFGMSKGTIDISTFEINVEELKLVKTEKPKGQKTVRVSSIDYQRARLLIKGFKEFTSDADIIFAEMPVGSQSAVAMKGYGVSIATIATAVKPLIQVSPDEVKMVAVGNKTASKKEMIDWAVDLYPNLNWPRARNNPTGRIVNEAEHLADSIAAAHAGIETEMFQAACSMLEL